jgi:DNA-directed RNA polymerase subunit N (RpoN/RPB10)
MAVSKKEKDYIRKFKKKKSPRQIAQDLGMKRTENIWCQVNYFSNLPVVQSSFYRCNWQMQIFQVSYIKAKFKSQEQPVKESSAQRRLDFRLDGNSNRR